MENKNKRISRLFSMQGASDALLLNQSQISPNQSTLFPFNANRPSQIELSSASNPNEPFEGLNRSKYSASFVDIKSPRPSSHPHTRSVVELPRQRTLSQSPALKLISLESFESPPIRRETTRFKDMNKQLELGQQTKDSKTVLDTAGTDIKVKFILDRSRIKAMKIINCVAFVILICVDVILYQFFNADDIYTEATFTKPGMYNPFIIVQHVDWLSWIVLQFFFFLFCFVPIFCTRDNYDLLLFEKVHYRFTLLALFLSGFLIVYSIGQELSRLWITPVLAFLVKLYEYYFIYSKVKYHDDGHDFVSRLEFICLHLTFSFSSAFLTYITVFCVFNSMSLTSHVDKFLGWQVLSWEKLFQTLIFSEACINLACYKDIFFALMIALVFIGQYLRGFHLRNINQQIHETCAHDTNCEKIHHLFEGKISEKLALSYFIILICFILLVLASNFRSVFYLKFNLIMQRMQRISGIRVPISNVILPEAQETVDNAGKTPVAMNDLTRVNQTLKTGSTLSEFELTSRQSSSSLQRQSFNASLNTQPVTMACQNTFKQTLLQRLNREEMTPPDQDSHPLLEYHNSSEVFQVQHQPDSQAQVAQSPIKIRASEYYPSIHLERLRTTTINEQLRSTLFATVANPVGQCDDLSPCNPFQTKKQKKKSSR